MKVEIKNPQAVPYKVKSLYEYFQEAKPNSKWEFNGFTVELDPTFDFEGDDVLIRWLDINEGFSDRLIVNSLKEFQAKFKEISA
ncbi:MAG: hypothetical protein ACK4GN_04320 [Runella sp.]